MNDGSDGGSYGRALQRLREAFQTLGRQRDSVRLAFAGALLMGFGALMPWAEYGEGDDFIGIEGIPGIAILAIAVAAVLLLVRLIRDGAGRDSGGIVALGLLAVAIMLAELNQVRVDDYADDAWGIWVTSAGAAVLLLAGFSVFGGSGETGDA